MTIRYASHGKMFRVHDGAYVAAAEHEELAQEIVEAAADHYQRIERGELTTHEAETAMQVLVKMLMS